MAPLFVSATVLMLACSTGQLKEFRPLPELRAEEVAPASKVLTTKNAKTFTKKETLTVGDNLTVILPVQLSTAYTWREAKVPEAVLKRIREGKEEDKNKEDLRTPSRGYWTRESGEEVGGVDALQVFRYRVKSAARQVPLRFELVRSFDGATDGKFFEVLLDIQERP